MDGVKRKTDVPTAVAVFPADLVRPPRAWAERTYNVARYTRMPRGGHFAAHEEPELLARDITAFFRPADQRSIGQRSVGLRSAGERSADAGDGLS